MSKPAAGALEPVHALRIAFDRAFAEARRQGDPDVDLYLAIRAAGEPLALRVAELVRLEARRAIVPLKGANSHLLGIAGIQGRLVPVYSLASLVGYNPAEADGCWLAVCGSPDRFALAFGVLEAHFSVSRSSLLESGGQQPPRAHARRAVPYDGGVRSVVDLDGIQAAIRTFAAPGGASRESMP